MERPKRGLSAFDDIERQARDKRQGCLWGKARSCGERNGSYRHGLYTREAIAERKAMRALIRGFREDARGALSALDATSGAKPSRARP